MSIILPRFCKTFIGFEIDRQNNSRYVIYENHNGEKIKMIESTWIMECNPTMKLNFRDDCIAKCLLRKAEEEKKKLKAEQITEEFLNGILLDSIKRKVMKEKQHNEQYEEHRLKIRDQHIRDGKCSPLQIIEPN